jgi:hypothetical protein
MASNPSDGFAAANGTAGIDDVALPIFDVERVQLQFSIAADFVGAQVANNVLVLALSNGRILRIDLNKPEDIDGTPRHYDSRQVTCGHANSTVLARHRPPQEAV